MTHQQLTVEYPDGAFLHVLYAQEWDLQGAMEILGRDNLFFSVTREHAEKGTLIRTDGFNWTWQPAGSEE